MSISGQELITHIDALRRYAMSLTHNPAGADDLVQNTLERALRNMEKFEPGTNLKAWLFTIQRNFFLSDCRRNRPTDNAVAIDDVAHLLSSHAQVDSGTDFRDFKRCFEQLNEREREVLYLVGAAELSYEEAAAIMDVELGTVKSRLSRARRRLNEIYMKATTPVAEQVEVAVVGRAA